MLKTLDFPSPTKEQRKLRASERVRLGPFPLLPIFTASQGAPLLAVSFVRLARLNGNKTTATNTQATNVGNNKETTKLISLFLAFLVLDINECRVTPRKCTGQHEICVNSYGSFSCRCRDQFQRNSQTQKCERKFVTGNYLKAVTISFPC